MTYRARYHNGESRTFTATNERQAWFKGSGIGLVNGWALRSVGRV